MDILEAHLEAAMLYGNRQHWHSWTGEPKDIHRDFVPEIIGDQIDCVFNPPKLLLTLLRPPRSATNSWGRTTTPLPSDFLLRRKLLERIGGFEEAFAGMYEGQVFISKVYLNEPVFVAGKSACSSQYQYTQPDSCSAIT